MECEDMQCDPKALLQSTRYCDVPKVTLIKGTSVYKNVAVLSKNALIVRQYIMQIMKVLVETEIVHPRCI
jgi:hypothetical protein